LCEVIGRAVDTVLYPGWVGVPCDGEETAAWLLRATVVEGLLARREEEVLYLPVGVGQTHSATERLVAVVADACRLWRVYAGGRS
jgi:sirohydrochlorin cobaltochelatase